MQVIVDPDYLDLINHDNKTMSNDQDEISPFTGKRCPTVSMEDIKKLISLPIDERKKMIQKIFVRYV